MSNLLFDPIKTMAKITDSVFVGFSTGKDSVCVFDLCFRYFKRVVPYFMYIAPNLAFQETVLQRYERKYCTEIIRIPHFMVSEFMRYGTFRDIDPNVPIVTITDEYEYLREMTGCDWVCAGERIADSIVRRAMIKNSGSIDRKRGRFYPIAHWTKNDVKEYIRYRGLFLSEQNRKMGFSFRSLAGCELSFIRDTYPEDYARILRLYPLADAAVERFLRYGQ